MAANGPLWTLMDEEESREYRVVPWFESDDGEGTRVLSDVAVVETLHLDDAGRVTDREVGPAARRYDERAWQLLQKDRGLRELMERTASPIAAAAVKSVGVTDETQAEVLESLRDLLQRRRVGRGRRDVS